MTVSRAEGVDRPESFYWVQEPQKQVTKCMWGRGGGECGKAVTV